MKQMLCIVAMGLLLIVTTSYAVEKTEKVPEKKVTKQAVHVVPPQQVDTTKRKHYLSPEARLAAKKRMNRKFDTFIDRNNNGIDDRRERCRAKKLAADSAKTDGK